MAAEHILIVDPDAARREHTQIFLQQAGYHVSEAATGFEGIRLAKVDVPDLILMDTQLPDVDGVTACMEIKAHPISGECFVVLVSNGHNSTLDTVMGLEGGAEGYMVRPMPDDEFRSRVNTFMRLRRTEKSLRESNAFNRAITRHSASIIYIYDVVENRNVWVNPGHWELFGTTVGEHDTATMGRDAIAAHLVHPDDWEQLVASTERLVTQPELAWQERQYRMKGVDGKWHWLHERATVFKRNDDGSVRQIIGTAVDISAQKEAEERLRLSEARFRALFEQSPLGMELYHPDGHLQLANPASLDLWGMTLDDMPYFQEHYNLRSDPDMERQGLQPYIEQGMNGDIAELPERLYDPEKSQVERSLRGSRKFWLRSYIYPVRDEDGHTQEVVLIHLDISAQKEAEERLRTSEQMHRTVLSNLSVGVVTHAPDTSIILANPRACELLGMTQAQILGKESSDPQWQFVREDGSPMPLDEYPVNRVLASHKPLENLVAGVRLANKPEVRWLLVHGFPVLDEAKNIAQVIINFIDLTDLRRTEATLRAFVEAAPIGIGVARGRVFQWTNSAMQQMFGYDEAELNGQSTRIIYASDDDYQAIGALYPQLEAGVTVASDEVRLRHKEGHVQHGMIRLAPLNQSNLSQGVIFTVSDITAQKHIERALRTNEQWLTRLLGDLPGAVYRCRNDQPWTMEFLSEGIHDLCGYYPEQLLLNQERSYRDVIHPDDRERVWQEVQRAVAQDTPYELEYRIRTAAGATKWVWERGHHLRIGAADEERIVLEGFITDITERKQNEERLRFQAMLLDTVQQAAVASDLDGIITYWNRYAETLYGWTHEEAIGKRARDLIPMELHPQSSQIAQGMYEGTSPSWGGEFMVQDKAGRIFPVLVRASSIPDEAGNSRGIISVSHDISTRKQNEERLRFQATLLDAVQQAAIATDLDGIITYWNRYAETLYGWTHEEAIGKRARDLIPMELHPQPSQIAQGMYEGTSPSWGGEFMVRDKQGRTFPIQVTNSPVYDSQGALVGIIGISYDISTRKEREAQLRERERFRRAITDTSASIMYIFDYEQRRNVWVNPTHRALLAGAADEDVATMSETALAAIIHDEDWQHVLSKNAELQANPDLPWVQAEYRIWGADGKWHWLHDRISVFKRADDGTILQILGTAIDVTEQKEAEEIQRKVEALRNEIEQEREVLELKERFVATATHDFRTPLSVIKMATSMLETYNERLREEQRLLKYRQIMTQVDHMSQMIDDVLDIYRVDAGKIVVKPQTVNLRDFVEGIWAEFQEAYGGTHDMRLSFAIPPQHEQVTFDPHLIQQALVNLIANAVKYTPEAGQVALRVEHHNHQVRMQLSDTGIGIPEDDLKLLFTPFHRAGNAQDYEGTGLGLTIVRNYIMLHQGTITCESEVGAGTTFHIWLPAQFEPPRDQEKSA